MYIGGRRKKQKVKNNVHHTEIILSYRKIIVLLKVVTRSQNDRNNLQ